MAARDTRPDLPTQIAEAKRQAEKLSRYAIRHHKGASILWRFDQLGWRIANVFPSDEAAVEYLFAKLPAIESQL